MDLTSEDSGGARRVRIGDQITVTLPERPTTGYRWRADVDDAVVRRVDDRYEGAGQPMGAGGQHVFVFEVVGTAPTTLRLVEGRSWEPDVVTGEFTVRLEPG